MKKELIVKLHADFESIVKVDVRTGVEFWTGRELQTILGYHRWENFSKVIEKARTSCKKSGYDDRDHFLEVTKLVDVGSGAQREIDDITLTRYACYLIAQNGDSSKSEIAFAQTYFAVQTRKQEVIEKRIDESERLSARKKLAISEKQLSGMIFERLGEGQSFAAIRSQGDQSLFGGLTTSQMKARLKVPQSRPLADFLPAITIKAKDFANEITSFNIKRDDLRTEWTIAREHVQNNKKVRGVLMSRGIKPEQLPADEDIRKVERRLQSEVKKLPKATEAQATPPSDPEPEV